METHRRGSDGRRFFTTQFKQEQIARVVRQELTLSELARELAVSPSVVRRWQHLSTKGSSAAVASNQEVVPVSELRAAQDARGVHPEVVRVPACEVGVERNAYPVEEPAPLVAPVEHADDLVRIVQYPGRDVDRILVQQDPHFCVTGGRLSLDGLALHEAVDQWSRLPGGLLDAPVDLDVAHAGGDAGNRIGSEVLHRGVVRLGLPRRP